MLKCLFLSRCIHNVVVILWFTTIFHSLPLLPEHSIHIFSITMTTKYSSFFFQLFLFCCAIKKKWRKCLHKIKIHVGLRKSLFNGIFLWEHHSHWRHRQFNKRNQLNLSGLFSNYWGDFSGIDNFSFYIIKISSALSKRK